MIEIVQGKIAKSDIAELPIKNVYIPSPAIGFGLILTYKEALKLLEMLGSAYNEAIALQMIQLFAE